MGVKGFLNFYDIMFHTVTILDSDGPSHISLEFEPVSHNVILNLEGLFLDLKFNADVSAAWFIPVTVERLSIYNLSFMMEFSGRKNDPEAYLPIKSSLKIDDYDIKIKEELVQDFANRLHAMVLKNIEDIA